MDIVYNDAGEDVNGGEGIFTKPSRNYEPTAHCVLPFIPYRLRDNEFYKRVNSLICLQDELFTDAEIRTYLDEAPEFVRTGLFSSYINLNWFSESTWKQVSDYNWFDNYASSGEDFAPRDLIPRVPNEQIWSNISRVNGEEHNEEGFKIWNQFVEPYGGTNLIQRQLLKSLRLDGTVLDWYEDLTPINTYSFLFDEFPGWDKTEVLIKASKVLKNAESKLTSVKDENCPHALILSQGGALDTDYLSDIYGEKFHDTYICFQRFVNDNFEVFSQFSAKYLCTKFRDEQINYWSQDFLSDNLILSEINFNKIFGTHASILPGTFVQLLPGYIKNLENEWQYGVTWEDHFTWRDVHITNLTRTRMYRDTPMDWTYINPVTGLTQTWETWATWEGDVDETQWVHNRPCTGADCIINRNFIPLYEPVTERSLYEVLMFKTYTSTFDPDADILIAREYIVQMWDPYFELGYMELDGDNGYFVKKTYSTVADPYVIQASDFVEVGTPVYGYDATVPTGHWVGNDWDDVTNYLVVPINDGMLSISADLSGTWTDTGTGKILVELVYQDNTSIPLFYVADEGQDAITPMTLEVDGVAAGTPTTADLTHSASIDLTGRNDNLKYIKISGGFVAATTFNHQRFDNLTITY